MKQLPEQQHKVLVGIAEGFETIALAAQLGLSPKTVEYHRGELYATLADEGVRTGNVADLVNYAISNDIVELRFSDMKITYPRALKILGLVNFELKNAKDFERIMDVWREQTATARRANNDILAADLSQCKEVIKKKWGILKGHICPRCTGHKGSNSEYCPKCAFLLKGEGEMNPDKNGESEEMYKVEDAVYIGPKSSGLRNSGELTTAIRKLVNVGDSFITNKSPTSVRNASMAIGIKTICRKITIGEKQKSKMRFRVWRTDGLKPSEVNQAIKTRLDAKFRLEAAGQSTPQQAPEPPPAEAVDFEMPTPPRRRAAAATTTVSTGP